MELTSHEIILRIGIAFIFSILFGMERQFRRKQVGFSTFAFVCIGACVLTLVAIGLSSNVTSPVTIIGGIITGIGFLGAGALIKPQDKKVFGFTSASAIWSFAALGITVGAGLYEIAAMFYLMIIAVILIDNYFERIGFGYYARTVSVTVKHPSYFERVRKVLPVKTRAVLYDFNPHLKEYTISFMVNANRDVVDAVPAKLAKDKTIKRFKVD